MSEGTGWSFGQPTVGGWYADLGNRECSLLPVQRCFPGIPHTLQQVEQLPWTAGRLLSGGAGYMLVALLTTRLSMLPME